MRDAIDGKTVHTWTHPEDPDIQVDYRLWTGPLYTTDIAAAADKVWRSRVVAVRGIKLPKGVHAPQDNVGLFWQGYLPSDICNDVVTAILADSRLSDDERSD